ncbi:hypothetical protein BDF20DRAFT_911650 [Mycotypha africana]|uniref:uncharacterized protein n=1 Tax=Mycotypha africana TaxID=64632 RepID=UPI002301330F|nr:uncharacterized protein BDF20DRAFT_911650 [Mycotypha africana]KAI8984564.1 hypothetical protein BDF20DRAFT_911650 [Mycotypha africana]
MEVEDDQAQRQNPAMDVREVLRKIRRDAGLSPLMSSRKRPIEIMEDKSQNEDNDSTIECEQTKKQKTDHVQEIDDNTEAAYTQLKNRLATYSAVFHSAPRPLTALQFAYHGWKDTHNVSTKDKLICIIECSDCKGQMFVIDIDAKHKDKPEGVLLEIERKYRTGLADCHKENCQWRYKRIDDGIRRLVEEGNLISAACKSKKESIPTLSHHLDDSFLNKLKYIVQHYKHGSEEERNTEYDAYILALYGWKLLHSDVPGIQCDLCFSRKAFYQLEGKVLDVMNGHKNYCPWKSELTANTISPKEEIAVISSTSNQRINGAQWLMDAVSIEYLWLIKKGDFTIEAKIRLNDKYQTLRNKIKASKYLVRYLQETVSNAKKLA